MDAIKLLKNHHIPITDLRLEICARLAAAEHPLSYEDLSDCANKTTIYRTMELFAQRGLCTKIEVDGKGSYLFSEQAYALFVCESCQKHERIDMPPVKFHANSAVVKGVCDECEQKSPHE